MGHSLLADVEELPIVTTESRSTKIPKSLRGIGTGGRLPGAYNVRQRATGEIPVWIQQEDTDNALEAGYNSSSTRSEVSNANQENDETCVVIAGAELSKPLSDSILIEGTTVNTVRIRLFLFLGFLALVIFIAGIAVVVTSKITSSTSGNPALYHDPLQGTLAPTSAPFEMQLDWTVADALLHNRGHLVALLTAGHLLFDILNDTETNFTYFGMIEEATLLANVDLQSQINMTQIRNRVTEQVTRKMTVPRSTLLAVPRTCSSRSQLLIPS